MNIKTLAVLLFLVSVILFVAGSTGQPARHEPLAPPPVEQTTVMTAEKAAPVDCGPGLTYLGMVSDQTPDTVNEPGEQAVFVLSLLPGDGFVSMAYVENHAGAICFKTFFSKPLSVSAPTG